MNPNIVDLVTRDPTTNEYVVILVQDEPWSDAQEKIEQLLKKITNYVRFIEDGQLYKMYPNAIGCQVRLQLDCNSPPVGEAASLIRQAQDLLLERGIGFAVNQIISAKPIHTKP